ncbi:MAG TPA: hypothetical protein VHZ03_29105 [Trebonia sp.]|nr:hypothetical protein [Trebonia sp.]
MKFDATQPVVFPSRLTGGTARRWQLSPLYAVTFFRRASSSAARSALARRPGCAVGRRERAG